MVQETDRGYLSPFSKSSQKLLLNEFDVILIGAGTGIYLTFATYMKKDSKVVTYALITPIINNLVSLMMGIVTFSTSFDYLTRHNPEMTQTGKLTHRREALD